tara:strand:- start:25863 stop:26210 length:348 start_codon:yes stop_codon:yes gene_type:complete
MGTDESSTSTDFRMSYPMAFDYAWALLKQERRRLGADRPPRRRLGQAPVEDDEGLYRLGPQKGTEEYEARQMENANRPPQPPAPPREPRWGNDLVQDTAEARSNSYMQESPNRGA